MGKLLFIDSDDINGLSEALRKALNRRGVVFGNPIKEYDYPDEEEDDYDPYLGVMPRHHIDTSNCSRDDDDWLFQESGGNRYNSGSCGSIDSWGPHCGGNRYNSGSCGSIDSWGPHC